MARRRSTHRPLELSFLFDLYAASQLAVTLSDDAVAAFGVDDGFAALSAIAVAGPMTLTELSSRLGTPLTTTSGLVRRLVGRQLVRRAPNPDDGRSSLLVLTARGRRALDRANPAFREMARHVERNLDLPVADVRATLRSLADAFRATLEAPG
jgi:DNA-binding MarR family transcriptional regulator